MTMRELRRCGERQLGLVTSRQARRLVGEHAMRSAVARGWLVSVRPQVLRFAGARPTWHQAVLAAVLAAGDDAAASHATAAAIWELSGFPASSATPIEVCVPRGRRPRLRGVRVHTSLIEVGGAVRGGVPVTSVSRTLCDLDGRLPAQRLAKIVDDALVKKLTTVDGLRRTYQALRGGRRSIRTIGRILAERGGEWDSADSRGEATLVRWLVAAGLPPPVQQHEVDGYRVDLAFPEQRVFIEYDGFDAHATRTSFDGDRRRANRLVLATGATVLRFTSASTREEVVEQVTLALSRRAS